MFQLEGKGKIGIVLDKPHYISGELVTGTIYVEAKYPIRCDGVVLKATGKEQVEWEETRMRMKDGQSERYEVEYDEKKEFFKQKIIVAPVQHELLPGNYAYPFQFQLPAGLPGSFEIKDAKRSWGEVNKLKAKIQYKFKATIDVGGYLAKDLKGKVEATIFQASSETLHAVCDSRQQTVRMACCIPMGECSLNAKIEKNIFMPNETAQSIVAVENQSKFDISAIKCRLMQVISLKADGHRKVISTCVAKTSSTGIQSGEASSQQLSLPLVGNNLYPSTMGKYLNCAYHIDIECDVPYCPDVALHLPITIQAPIILQTTDWIPVDPSHYNAS